MSGFVRATHPIRKGDEITISYNMEQASKDLNNRGGALSNILWFYLRLIRMSLTRTVYVRRQKEIDESNNRRVEMNEVRAKL
jgi:hypothetical protein